jgi:hypothetical protein
MRYVLQCIGRILEFEFAVAVHNNFQFLSSAATTAAIPGTSAAATATSMSFGCRCGSHQSNACSSYLARTVQSGLRQFGKESYKQH